MWEIRQLGFSCAVSNKTGVKIIEPVEHSTGSDITWTPETLDPARRRLHFVLAQANDQLHSSAQILQKTVTSRDATSDPDDRDIGYFHV